MRTFLNRAHRVSAHHRSSFTETVRKCASPSLSGQTSLISLDQLKQHQYDYLGSNSHIVRSSLDNGEDLDLPRARCFLAQGSIMDARQALAESLRWHPFSHETRRLLLHVDASLAPILQLPREICEAEPMFAMLYDALKHHSMLTWPRLFSLYMHAKELAQAGEVVGDVVECGCAGGGSAVLMAATLAYFSQSGPGCTSSRRVFAFDTFAGMPPPTQEDRLLRSEAEPADGTHWSTGTCSGSALHVHALARAFNVTVHTVPGLFHETLPLTIQIPPVRPGPSLQSCAFLHCDADWYESTACVLRTILPIMSPKSFVQVDDYHYWTGCKKAVDEVLTERSINPNQLSELDGNAVLLSVS